MCITNRGFGIYAKNCRNRVEKGDCGLPVIFYPEDFCVEDCSGIGCLFSDLSYGAYFDGDLYASTIIGSKFFNIYNGITLINTLSNYVYGNEITANANSYYNDMIGISILSSRKFRIMENKICYIDLNKPSNTPLGSKPAGCIY